MVSTEHEPLPPLVDDIVALLSRLHREKSAAYGNAWRKRVELFSAFPHLARKYDRFDYAVGRGELRALLAGAPSRAAETLIDTIADLLVYAVKYLTLLDHVSDDHEAEVRTFEREISVMAATVDGVIARPEPLIAEITNSMTDLEGLLQAQVDDRSRMRGLLLVSARATLQLVTIAAAAAAGEYARFARRVLE